jgi:hypothetical protein
VGSYSGFNRRLAYGQKFEKRLVEIFNTSGFQSSILEFESAQENAENGDLDVWTKDGRQLRLEAKYTCKISLRSIDRFNGQFYILTPHSNEESPTKITAEKIYVIPKKSIKAYARQMIESGKVFKMKSGDLGIELNLGQYNSGFEFGNKVTLDKFIKDGLLFL